jgi:hypothetical protein
MLALTEVEVRMRWRSVCLILAALATVSPQAPARAQAMPPHAWLFGTWTGGLFPVPQGMSAEMCLAQPVVIFSKDVVLRGTLTDPLYQQRIIQTARSNPAGTEFRFEPGSDSLAVLGAGLLGTSPPPPQRGFGCESPDVLHVQRRGENEIVFPGCADFPEPLYRCPSR